MLTEILIIFITYFFIFYLIVYLHECAHKAIFNNYGIPARINFQFLKPQTIGKKQIIEKLDKREYQNMQFAHALIEISTFIILSFFFIAYILIIITKFLL